jgi:uncharacterized protein
MTRRQQLALKRQAIIEIAARYGVHDLKIFGSVVREEETTDSDIDFLVKMDKGRSLLDYIGFIQELESLLECKVDVAQPTTLHPVIREQILQEAVPL